MRRVVVAAGLIRGQGQNADRFLISRRPPDIHLGDTWEFPGGKVEAHESPEAALRRELKEELGIDVRVGDVYAVGHHIFEDRVIFLLVYDCVHVDGQPRAIEVAEFRWVTGEVLLEVPFPVTNEPVVDRLRREMG